MTNELRTRATRRDTGFTLVELLVVMVVLGILAAVAIPALVAQRRRSYRATLKSDLRNAATSNEAYAVGHDGAYAPAGAAGLTALAAEGFHVSADVTLTVVDDRMAGNGGGFCFKAAHAKLGAGNLFYFASSGPTAGNPTETACTAS